MKKSFWLIVCFMAVTTWLTASSSYEELTRNFTFGKVEAQSLSVMTFGPEGILFIGDAKGGNVFALDLNDRVQNTTTKGFGVADVEGKLASLLGTDPKGVIIQVQGKNVTAFCIPNKQDTFRAKSHHTQRLSLYFSKRKILC